MENILKKLGRNKITSSSDFDADTDMKIENDDLPSPTEDIFNCDNNPEIPNSTSKEELGKEEKKAKNVSIDITKALVILGFSNWSELDLGMKYTYTNIYHAQCSNKRCI